MFPIRVKVCQESDLRMLGSLARNIQRVLPVTQADIDAAAALGKGWVVWKVIEVNDPLDNLRGGTQLVIKQNSVQPGQNVRRVIFVSGPGGETVVIGPAPSPLLLPDAIANSLHYVKAYGGTEQNGTPTPTSPVDIVCNNGVLKVRHQSGLPLGYQPYEYLTASGNQWLNTGVKLASTDIVETEFKNNSTTGYGALYGVFALGDSSAFYANGTYYGYDETNGKVNTGVSVDTNWHTLRQDFGNGVITLDGNDTTYTPFEFENTKYNYLFARYYNNGYGYGFKGSCKRFKVIRNGVVICDLIPVVQLSDNAIGMYDLANNVFRGNLGTGDFDITNPINDLEVYVDGTVETIEDTIGNTATCEPLLSVGDYSDVQEILSGAVTRNIGIKMFDGTEDWVAHSSAVGTYRYRLDGKLLEKSLFFSTHFVYSSATSTELADGEMMCGAASSNIYVCKTDIATLNDFKAWLASQYAAGTPVIVVYPLAEPTTESVAGQTLQVAQGDNTLEITQASISGLELEAQYEQGVQASVEEIEP